jgi:hypothetical protein
MNGLKGYISIMTGNYLSRSHRLIHTAVRKPFFDQDVKYWVDKGFEITEQTNFHVCHLNDKRWDFRVDNLFYAPAQINWWCRKTTTETLNVSFCHFNTKSVNFVHEAMHAKDVLKIVNVPDWAKEFIFNHGLNRPLEFQQYYESIDTLMSRSNVYKTTVTNSGARPNLNKFTILQESEWDDDLKIYMESIAHTDSCFDAENHMVIEYRGTKGALWQTVVDKSVYESELKECREYAQLNRGYVQIGNKQLHNIALGLDYAYDGLHTRHLYDNPLDNRICSLNRNTIGRNLADINQKTEKSMSVYTGVSLDKKRNKWYAQIQIDCNHFNLGRFDDEENAQKAYNYLNEKRLEWKDYDQAEIWNAIHELRKNRWESAEIKLPEPKKTTSDFKGVIWDSARELWIVNCYCKNKNMMIGRFEDEAEAGWISEKFRAIKERDWKDKTVAEIKEIIGDWRRVNYKGLEDLKIGKSREEFKEIVAKQGKKTLPSKKTQ